MRQDFFMPNPTKNTICLFACHFKNKQIPLYIKLYLQEIAKHTDRIILINCEPVSLESDQKFLDVNNIELFLQANQGHDFGSWMKALENINTKEYDQFILANDSCILTQTLGRFMNWLEASSLDFAGLINSNERKYHIQSYFTVYSQKGLEVLQQQFKKHGLISDKRKLIKTYEIGLSQQQIKAKNKLGTFVEVPKSNSDNPLFHQTLSLIKSKFPLVKKQLVFNQLSKSDIEAMSSAGIYLGAELVKDAIKEHCTLKNANWDALFKDAPIN